MYRGLSSGSQKQHVPKETAMEWSTGEVNLRRFVVEVYIPAPESVLCSLPPVRAPHLYLLQYRPVLDSETHFFSRTSLSGLRLKNGELKAGGDEAVLGLHLWCCCSWAKNITPIIRSQKLRALMTSRIGFVSTVSK